MRLRSPFIGIRQKAIAILVAIGLIPVIVTGITAFLIVRNEISNTTTNQLQSTATRQEQRINALLQVRQEEVIRLSNQFDFQIALSNYLQNPGSEYQDILFDILQEEIIQSTDIQNIYLTDLSSTVITGTADKTSGYRLSGEQFTVPEEEQTHISVARDPQDNTDKLYITTRISINNEDVAYLAFVFRMNDIIAVIQDYTGLGSTGETVVASHQDGQAVSLFPLRFDTGASLTTNLDFLDQSTAPSGEFNAVDYRGESILTITRPIRFTDWVMATKIDASEAFAGVQQLRDALVGIILATSAIIVALSFAVSRLISDPVRNMANVAQRIGQGDLSARINLRRNDEIGTLAQSIDSMGDSLSRFVQHIESDRNRLSIIINNASESILAIDKDERVALANRATSELTHLPLEEIDGRPIQEIFTWTRGQVKVPIQYNTPEDQTYPNLEFQDSHGNIHYAKLIIAKIRTKEQMALQTIVTIHDETKQRELENMKLDFVSMAAHELRTPLASLRGYLELIRYKSRKELSPDMDHSIKQALRSSSELGGLINNLLDVSRIESGTLALSLGKVDLAKDVVLPAIKDVSFSATDKNITLAHQGLAEDCYIYADKITMREVIDNLLSNAIKYTNPGGSITVTIRKEGTKFVVDVADTGVGIPERALSNLFTKFYRVHGGLASGSIGTGLGLFITKSILERHNGDIRVASKEGIGSTFSFTVPEYAQQEIQPNEETRRHRGWVTKNITR